MNKTLLNRFKRPNLLLAGSLLLLVFFQTAFAQNQEVGNTTAKTIDQVLQNLEISGFFDLQQKIVVDQNQSAKLSYGQFEIDIAKQFSENIYFDAAIAYDSEIGNFTLGAGCMHIKFSSNEQNDQFFNGGEIILGQFDLPFGIDYECIPSPDRKLVSAPVAVEKTMNCMNTFGLMATSEISAGNALLYFVNGLYEGSVTCGGRIVANLNESIDFGASFLFDMQSIDNFNTKAFGTDLRMYLGDLELKSEYYYSSGLIDGEIDCCGLKYKSSGYYLQLLYQLQHLTGLPMFVTGRYGQWFDDLNSVKTGQKGDVNRLTLGVGYEIVSSVECKLEYLTDIGDYISQINQLTGQLVVSF